MLNAKLSNDKANQSSYPFNLPNLPYDATALEPHLSSNTFSFHHGKHHQAYVTNLNNLLKEHEFAKLDLEKVIASSAGKNEYVGIFNNAAQVWNHSFYWHSMKQNGGGQPSGTLLGRINTDFGSFDNFAQEFKQAGATQFGSGWAWLVLDLNDNKLKVTKTANADLPITKNQVAIITADVWEHAYYLDYQNRRPDYLAVFLEKLVNWDFAQANFDKAIS
ncbi:superoxide dismutase [Rickettsiales endosymbiont of Stachyamoeba lipophora]|uniref:superoxide dismutase n=1 Tax=Rickettsiales endosymbiont of Stachyamoeba lipophora TaxID=2486578 RepID=UPI000F647B06|nr:superoxide dismutase [Rickettsiales endosymbiont of Stachyamoeba lipophora]AZL16133.1 superoxide dismutase [Rickettsiales endosymbiont of Stachyamoeba lipophora]